VVPGQARPNFTIVRPPQLTLTEGQEACFFLKKHDKGDFNVVSNPYYGLLDKKAPQFEANAKLIREIAKFLETPLEKSLDSEKAEDRLLAAGMLILKYRTRKDYTAQVAEEPIEAAESKKILKALAEADFTKVEPHLGQTPVQLFFQLGVTEKD